MPPKPLREGSTANNRPQASGGLRADDNLRPWTLLRTAGCLATAKHPRNHPHPNGFSRSAQTFAERRHSQARPSPAPALPPSPPRGYSFPPRASPPGRATRCDQPKSRRISRRSRTRPFDFPSDTAIVRFLSPPLTSRPPGHPWPRRAFLRGILPRASFGNWRKQQRTRCNLNGCSESRTACDLGGRRQPR